MYVYFSDGSIRLVDVRPLIHSGSVFEPLEDIEIFKSSITVLNDTVAWDLFGDRNSRRALYFVIFVLYFVLRLRRWHIDRKG